MSNIKVQSDEEATYEFLLHNKQYQDNIFNNTLKRITTYIDTCITYSENKTFLELGFNDGRLLKSLQKNYPTAKFIGVEVRQPCVDNMIKQGFDCRLITEELFPLNETFDVIYGASVLHHVSKPFALIKHLFNVLMAKNMNGGGGDTYLCQ